VGQNLTVVGINLNILRAAINADRLTVHQHCLLDDALLLVEQTAEFTRSLMAELRPPDMDDYGLIAAIKWYAERFSMRTGLEVVVKGEEIQPRPSAYIENNLFRIVQEALTNIRKHAGATKVQIRINVAARKLRIRITDDGRGFAPEKLHATPEYQGLGLMNMAERTDAVGGRFSIIAAIGKGAEIAVEVPL